MISTQEIPTDVPAREATPGEYTRMTGFIRWAYDHGHPVVFWPRDNVITLLPGERAALTPKTAVILRR